jgi:metallophosphoesterase superfamily enzyme
VQSGRDWIWVAGNHDPEAPAGLAGRAVETFAAGPLTFRHAPSPEPCAGEIAGHLHPAATVAGRGRAVRRRCFIGDGHRVVMPAFGAYAGGLDVFDRAFAGLFADAFRVFMLGDGCVYPVGRQSLRPY